MARVRTQYVCQQCGHASPRWLGQCPSCGGWNTFSEERVDAPSRVAPSGRSNGVRPQRISEVSLGVEHRLRTGIGEFDRVVGGGIMHGSLTLIAGDPGIGKSTLMTELARYMPETRILYVTGEESTRQVRLRAERLGIRSENLFLYAETNVQEIITAAQEVDPELMIVDSIQTVFDPEITSAPGSVSQVRESASGLLGLTKSMNFPTFIVGHVTKEGSIAGPRVLEHMVDAVLYFEGDRHHAYRILRTIKNRFGSTNEIGLFEMREHGLRPVDNPSEIFLSERHDGSSGSVVICSMEGTRPILVEIQALVTPASYGTPQRTATGFDMRRLQMLLAVLEKRAGHRMGMQDVFLNVAGGVRLEEPAVDLGVIASIASSFQDRPIGAETFVVGEVGLGGEIRTVNHVERRLGEAARLGFRHAVIPKGNLKGLRLPDGITIDAVRRLDEALDLLV